MTRRYIVTVTNNEETWEPFNTDTIKPVVHAHWEEWIGDTKCTSCGFICGDDYYFGSKNYCPNCGAKMEEPNKT